MIYPEVHLSLRDKEGKGKKKIPDFIDQWFKILTSETMAIQVSKPNHGPDRHLKLKINIMNNLKMYFCSP